MAPVPPSPGADGAAPKATFECIAELLGDGTMRCGFVVGERTHQFVLPAVAARTFATVLTAALESPREAAAAHYHKKSTHILKGLVAQMGGVARVEIEHLQEPGLDRCIVETQLAFDGGGLLVMLRAPEPILACPECDMIHPPTQGPHHPPTNGGEPQL